VMKHIVVVNNFDPVANFHSKMGVATHVGKRDDFAVDARNDGKHDGAECSAKKDNNACLRMAAFSR